MHRFLHFLHTKADNVTRTLWYRQEVLAEEYGVSVSTVKRFIQRLRDAGVIMTRYRWASRGKRLANAIQLTWSDPRLDSPQWNDQGLPPAYSPTDEPHINRKVSRPTSSLRSEKPTSQRSVNASLRSVSQAQQPASSSKKEEDMKPTVVPGQASFFTEEEGFGLDGEKTVVETGRNDVCRERKEGTPTKRLISYWLAGRTHRPARHVIMGMGRAIKKCIESGATEEEIREALDGLMRTGLDIFPRHLMLRFGLSVGKQKQRDYEKDPLRANSPKVSTMTLERRQQLAERKQQVTARFANSTSEIRESVASSTGLLPPTLSETEVNASASADIGDVIADALAQWEAAGAGEGYLQNDPYVRYLPPPTLTEEEEAEGFADPADMAAFMRSIGFEV